MLDRLPGRPVGVAFGKKAELGCFAEVDNIKNQERRADKGRNDGKGSKAPSETWTVEEGIGKRTANPDGNDIRRIGERKHERSVLERGRIGDKDTATV